jgi:two-component system response regulator AlgR
MPGMDGLAVARELGRAADPPAVIFVTAHEDFAVEAFDLDAIDYVLKPVARDRLERAVSRVLARRGARREGGGRWLREFWVPHRSELLRIDVNQVERIDAERDYVRLHVGGADGADSGGGRSYLLLQTIAGLEAKLDPEQFIRIHRSTILRRDSIKGLRHEGLGVWSVELANGEALRIGRTYLHKVKAMTGR